MSSKLVGGRDPPDVFYKESTMIYACNHCGSVFSFIWCSDLVKLDGQSLCQTCGETGIVQYQEKINILIKAIPTMSFHSACQTIDNLAIIEENMNKEYNMLHSLHKKIKEVLSKSISGPWIHG